MEGVVLTRGPRPAGRRWLRPIARGPDGLPPGRPWLARTIEGAVARSGGAWFGGSVIGGGGRLVPLGLAEHRLCSWVAEAGARQPWARRRCWRSSRRSARAGRAPAGRGPNTASFQAPRLLLEARVPRVRRAARSSAPTGARTWTTSSARSCEEGWGAQAHRGVGGGGTPAGTRRALYRRGSGRRRARGLRYGPGPPGPGKGPIAFPLAAVPCPLKECLLLWSAVMAGLVLAKLVLDPLLGPLVANVLGSEGPVLRPRPRRGRRIVSVSAPVGHAPARRVSRGLRARTDRLAALGATMPTFGCR